MHTAEFIARLKSFEPQLRACGVGGLYLFGSYARDEASADSDVDVFVDKAPGAAFGLDELVEAYEILTDALPVNVDYGTRTGLSKFIRADVSGKPFAFSDGCQQIPPHSPSANHR